MLSLQSTSEYLMEFASKHTTEKCQLDTQMRTHIETYQKKYPDHAYIAITPKEIAVMMGHHDIVAAFNNHALYKATKIGDLVAIRDLLTTGINFNQIMPNGATALAIAAKNGHLDIVQALMDAPAIDLNQKNDYGMTALLIAVDKNHLHVVAVLLQHHANPNLANKDGNTALFYAAQYGNTPIVHALIQAGANINKSADNDVTALYLAAKYDYLDTVLALLSAPNIAFNSKKSPLQIARDCGHTAVIVALEEHVDGPQKTVSLRP
jgi:ankyrin repeat protein